MNILFLTISSINCISDSGIYTDLMRKFRDEGHSVYIASPVERRFHQSTNLIEKDGVRILSVKTLNLQKTNLIEKGIGTILLEYQFLNAIKSNFSGVKFDLVVYSTPPITFTKIVKYVKRKFDAKSYLLLKDIFPQNAVDLGFIKKKSLIHRYFLKKESALYNVSDFIGCMSEANVRYILNNNSNVDVRKIEVNPNSMDLSLNDIDSEMRDSIRNKYSIPKDVVAFIYGGNLGKPQGIDFLIEVLNANMSLNDRFFVIVGKGTELSKLQSWMNANQPHNVLLIDGLPKAEYDLLLQSCDVGLIFLDRRFTIPNFPSRILSYMETKKPILAATDLSTDLGEILVDNGFGLWVESGLLIAFNKHLEELINDFSLRSIMGNNGYNYMKNNYLVDFSYNKIIRRMANV